MAASPNFSVTDGLKERDQHARFDLAALQMADDNFILIGHGMLSLLSSSRIFCRKRCNGSNQFF